MAERKRRFQLYKMRCAGCARNIEKTISSLPGVSDVYVNFASSLLTLTASPKTLPDSAIISAIRKAGFDASLPTPSPAEMEAQEKQEERREFLRFLVALVFTLPLFILAMWGHNRFPGWGQILLLLPVLAAGRRFFLDGIPALLRGKPDMDSLISCGAGAGILYSLYLLIFQPHQHLYFDAAAMILTLVMLGRLLEGRSRRRAAGTIRELLKLAPESATLIENGMEKKVPAASLLRGLHIRIRPGEKFPADGIIRSGSSDVNEAMLTGEAMPISKRPGDAVSGGTLNIDGTLEVEVSETGEASVLGRIVALISEAQGSRPPIAALADRVSGYFTWFIIGCSLVTAALWLGCGAGIALALRFALSVLVVACPCALGLATPIALIAGIGRGAAFGILIKNGTVLEKAAHASDVVLDKTGTVTSGTPEVRKLHIFQESGFDEKSFMQVAGSAERFSEHPLARAIEAAAGVPLLPITDFRAIPGGGISGTIAGKPWLFGNPALLAEHGISVTPPDDLRGLTLVYGACAGVPIGVIGIGDAIRPETPAAVAALQKEKFRVWLFTGDNPDAAQSVADSLHLTGFRAALRPGGKCDAIRKLQQEHRTPVVMVGDGINDAPALAQSDVGIAVGSGSAAAIESADIVLLRSDLRELPRALRLSRAVLRVIRQNLFWAFFYNLAGIPLAGGVLYAFGGPALNPAFCAGMMAASSLTVVLNALRLRRFR